MELGVGGSIKEVGPLPETKIFTSGGFEVRENHNRWLMVANNPVHLELEFLITKDGPEIVSETGYDDKDSAVYKRLIKDMKNAALFEYRKRNAPLKQKPLF